MKIECKGLDSQVYSSVMIVPCKSEKFSHEQVFYNEI